MALSQPSLFLYGFQITANNRSIDFQSALLGPEKMATLTLGFYTLGELAQAIEDQMNATDPTNTYTVSVNRNVSGGTENRVTISTNGSYLNLLFGTGTRAASTVATIIGFASTDYTGSLTYTGSSSAGTRLIPTLVGYNFLPPELYRKVFGVVNVSSSGVKETVVYNVQKFWQVQFKYNPSNVSLTEWSTLLTWMMLQKPIEFTPEITNPTLVYDGTLESTNADGKGLAFTMTEMLSAHPNLYDTGLLKFRVRE